jgi:metal-dependent amidase/aminoacylase/carboxypeptidase family protein
MVTTTRLHNDIDEMLPGLVADRRYLHENPELGCEEFVTSAFVIDRLRKRLAWRRSRPGST